MNAKQAAGYRAAEWVKDGMTIGLGTGSTAYYAIEKIGEMVGNGLKIRAIATSKASEELAAKYRIPMIQAKDVDRLDLAIDGADEVDPQMALIKGGGGALLREKLVAINSDRFIVIADQGKMVSSLGRFQAADRTGSILLRMDAAGAEKPLRRPVRNADARGPAVRYRQRELHRGCGLRPNRRTCPIKR